MSDPHPPPLCEKWNVALGPGTRALFAIFCDIAHAEYVKEMKLAFGHVNDAVPICALLLAPTTDSRDLGLTLPKDLHRRLISLDQQSIISQNLHLPPSSRLSAHSVINC